MMSGTRLITIKVPLMAPSNTPNNSTPSTTAIVISKL